MDTNGTWPEGRSEHLSLLPGRSVSLVVASCGWRRSGLLRHLTQVGTQQVQRATEQDEEKTRDASDDQIAD